MGCWRSLFKCLSSTVDDIEEVMDPSNDEVSGVTTPHSSSPPSSRHGRGSSTSLPAPQERRAVERPWGYYSYQQRPAAPHCPAGRTMVWNQATTVLPQGKRPDRRMRRLHADRPHVTVMRDGSTWTSYPAGWTGPR